MNSNRFTISGSWGVLKLVLALFLLLALIAPGKQDSLAVGTTIYVDADASGDDDGTSWDDAFTDLQAGLAAAESGDEIWVAEGTYKPTEEHGGSGDRYKSFQMVNGVVIYGGFDGTEDLVHERDWEAHPTILSGDLDGDDEPGFVNNDENSYHVFYHPSELALDGTASLDGFTITGGNANGLNHEGRGGGMHNGSASPTLTNCTFLANSTSFVGGGMYNGGSSSPTLSNVAFSNNSAQSGGGGMYNEGSSPTLTNCAFENNSTLIGDGAGMFNGYSSPVLIDCSFKGNSAGGWGGGMRNEGSSPTLVNCIFSGNLASNGGGMHNQGNSSPTLTNCTFFGNSASSGSGGIYNRWFSTPTLTNCILWADSPDEIANDPESSSVVTFSDIQGGYDGVGNIDAYPWFIDPDNGDFHLGPCSPCIDRGNNLAENLPEYDFEGDDRILDGNGDGTATVDMGVDEVAVAGTCFRVYLPVVMRNH